MLWFLSQLCQWPGGLLQAIASKWTSVEVSKYHEITTKVQRTKSFHFLSNLHWKPRFSPAPIWLWKFKFFRNKFVRTVNFFLFPKQLSSFSPSFSVLRNSQGTGQALFVFCVSYQRGLQSPTSEVPDLLLVLQLRKHISTSLLWDSWVAVTLLLGLLGRRHICKVILCSDASSWEMCHKVKGNWNHEFLCQNVSVSSPARG